MEPGGAVPADEMVRHLGTHQREGPEYAALASAIRSLVLGGSGYGPRGVPSLRRAVAAHFEERGVPTSVDQVVVTSGAQHALRLLLDVLTAPGDHVLMETPSYPNAFEALRRSGVRAVPLP